MGYYSIKGGNKLCGEINVGGSKNGTLPILIGSLLTDEEIILENCPCINDVDDTIKILRELGCSVKEEKNKFTDTSTITICSKDLNNSFIPEDLGEKMRCSILFLGALLSRNNECIIPRPGGCVIGERPIDLHLKAFKNMGVNIEEQDNYYNCKVSNILGYHIYLDFPSVGATENILLLGVKAKGVTVIHNCAREPEIVSLVKFLRSCGGEIYGEGTDTIMIEGVEKLHGTVFKMPFDRIQCGTFLCASAITGGEIFIKGGELEGMESTCCILERVGCKFKFEERGVFCKAPKELKSNLEIVTAPYPMFPSDMQPLIVALLAVSKGKAVVRETIFENRFAYVLELQKMNCNICINGDDNSVSIVGSDCITGCEVYGKDLRGGMALILAGLVANGESIVHGVEFIHRGYGNIQGVLSSLGGDIKLIY